MDDNAIVFATIMKVFATIIVYSTHEQKNIEHTWQTLLFQLNYYPFNVPHPWVFFAIIHGFSMI
jgi:hypothetical protein